MRRPDDEAGRGDKVPEPNGPRDLDTLSPPFFSGGLAILSRRVTWKWTKVGGME